MFSLIGLPTKAITNDDKDHLLFCLRVLSERTPSIVKVFTDYCRSALNEMLVAEEEEEATYQKAKQKTGAKIQPDDPIPFIQLQADKSGNWFAYFRLKKRFIIDILWLKFFTRLYCDIC